MPSSSRPAHGTALVELLQSHLTQLRKMRIEIEIKSYEFSIDVGRPVSTSRPPAALRARLWYALAS